MEQGLGGFDVTAQEVGGDAPFALEVEAATRVCLAHPVPEPFPDAIVPSRVRLCRHTATPPRDTWEPAAKGCQARTAGTSWRELTPPTRRRRRRDKMAMTWEAVPEELTSRNSRYFLFVFIDILDTFSRSFTLSHFPSPFSPLKRILTPFPALKVLKRVPTPFLLPFLHLFFFLFFFPLLILSSCPART